MIGKQFKNRSFRSTLDYVLGKEKAAMLDSNMGGITPRQLALEFGAARRLKPNLQRACAHVILSVPHRDASHTQGEYHEHLEDEQYVEIAQHWLKEMKFIGDGLNKSQYVIARHHDTEHEHIHIIASRIRMDATVVSDSWDYRRSEVVVRQLEKEYGLEPTPCSSEKVATKVKEEYGIETTVSHRHAQTQKQKHHSSIEPPITQLLADIIDEATQDKPTVTELIARLQEQNVVIHPQFSTRGLFKDAIAFEMDGVKVAGNKLGAAYSFPGLQKKRGVSYDPKRDLPALRLCADGKLVELPPSASKQLIEASPPEDDSVASPSIFEKLKLSINAAAADYLSMPEIIAKLYSTGVKVKVEFSTQGLAKGISYEIDGSSINSSNLGEQYSFEGLQNLGVDYNPEWDNQLIETILDYSNEGRSIDDSYIDRLRRYRQTKQLEQQRMKQVNWVLGIEEEVPMAIAPVEPENIDNQKVVIHTDSQPSVIKVSTTIGDHYETTAKDSSSNNSVKDDTLEGDTAPENDLLQTSISQEYADKIGATIRLLWQRLGQPQQINGQHYDLELIGETFQVMRKSGEQIASVPLDSSATASFQGFTQEDWDRFDKVDAVLKAEHLRPRQQRHQSGIELD